MFIFYFSTNCWRDAASIGCGKKAGHLKANDEKTAPSFCQALPLVSSDSLPPNHRRKLTSNYPPNDEYRLPFGSISLVIVPIKYTVHLYPHSHQDHGPPSSGHPSPL